jgi:WD40 repeat protein
VRTASAVAAVLGVLAIGAAYEARIAERQRDAALAAQSRALTQTAAARLKDGDPSGALSILLHVLPSKRAAGIPYSPQALSVFQVARATDSQLLTVAHGQLLFSAAFAHDGSRFATTSADRTARIWDAATGHLLVVLSGHARAVISADFSPNGKQIVTGSFDSTAKIWDTDTGREISTLKGHTGTVLGVAFSPDGKRVVTASGDKTARVWDVVSGQELAQVKHTGLVRYATFSPDGTRISTASYDNTARIWDAASGKELIVLRGHTAQVWCAAFSRDGKKIVTASYDNTARIWDADSGRQLLLLSGHTNQVNYAAFSPDGLKVITASDDKTARIWDAATGRQTGILLGHTDGVMNAVFSPDGRFALTSSIDKSARMWSLDPAQQEIQLDGHTSVVASVRFSPDGTRLLSASYDKTARIWDAATGQQVRILDNDEDLLERAVFSPDGRLIATASDDGSARIWEATTGAQIARLKQAGKVRGLAFSPDGLRLASGPNGRNNDVVIWEILAARIVVRMSGHTETISMVSFSPDGRRILTSAADKTARIWDAATGQQLMVLAHKERVSHAAYSPDGKRLITTSADKTARIWDPASGQQLLVLSGHNEQVEEAQFSPDGRRVVTAGYDRTARIWDSTTGDELGALVGHTDLVESAVFSPDGERIATSSDDNSVRIWSARTSTLENQIIWTEAAQFDPLPSTERFDLGIAAPTDVRVWPADRTRCDEAAAAPYDPERRASGAMAAQIVADIALAACGNNESSSSPDTRNLYQHARALTAAGKYPEARKEFEDALAQGYAAAGIDLGALLSRPAAGMLDVPRAIGLYQKAWGAGLHFAAFALGDLYEHGVSQSTGTQTVAADLTQAWDWYEKGAAVAEPSALARLGDRDDGKALSAADPAAKQAALLAAFRYYAAAAGRARKADWPEDAWRDWRYRRASLARVLAREGMLDAVVAQYDQVLRGYGSVKAD